MSRGFISLIFGLGGGTVILLSSFKTCSLLILQTLSTEYTGTLDSGIGLIFSCSESKKNDWIVLDFIYGHVSIVFLDKVFKIIIVFFIYFVLPYKFYYQ